MYDLEQTNGLDEMYEHEGKPCVCENCGKITNENEILTDKSDGKTYCINGC